MASARNNIRRSGAVLRSIGSGHQELNMVIAQIRNWRTQTKALRDTEFKVLHDITNWICKDENLLLKEMIMNLMDLQILFVNTQTEFAGKINEFRDCYESILESDKTVNGARDKLHAAEAAEEKAKKKLKRLRKRGSAAEINEMETIVANLATLTEDARAEVVRHVRESEAEKMKRVKESFVKMADAYIALSSKTAYVFEGFKNIISGVPKFEDVELMNYKFPIIMAADHIFDDVKEYLETYEARLAGELEGGDPPPPYTQNYYIVTPAVNPYYSALPRISNHTPATRAATAIANANIRTFNPTAIWARYVPARVPIPVVANQRTQGVLHGECHRRVVFQIRQAGDDRPRGGQRGPRGRKDLRTGNNQQGNGQQGNNQQGTSQQGTNQQGTSQQGTNQQGNGQQGTNQQGNGQPRIGQQGNVQPGNVQPRMGQQVNVQPRMGQQVNVQPRMGQQVNVQPRIGQLVNVQPRIGQLVNVQPRIGQQVNVQPRIGQQVNVQPRIGQQVNVQPRNDQPRNDQPRNDQPRNDQPRNDQPRNDQPRNDQPRNDQPRNDQPRNDQPRNDQPRNDQPRNDQPRNDGQNEHHPDIDGEVAGAMSSLSM